MDEKILNIVFGILSLLALISGFLIKDYRMIFWISGLSLLILVTISYYVMDNRTKLLTINKKVKKMEESLNVYDRLAKLENKVFKRGQINLMDIIKIGLAIIIIWAFIQAIKSLG